MAEAAPQDEPEIPAEGQFHVVVPQNYQLGPAADGSHILVVIDAGLPSQFAYVLSTEDAARMTHQLHQAVGQQRAMQNSKPKLIVPNRPALVGATPLPRRA